MSANTNSAKGVSTLGWIGIGVIALIIALAIFV